MLTNFLIGYFVTGIVLALLVSFFSGINSHKKGQRISGDMLVIIGSLPVSWGVLTWLLFVSIAFDAGVSARFWREGENES